MNDLSTQTTEQITTVKVNGKTFEVEAKVISQIDHMKVGDHVGVLKKGYSSTYTYHHGVIMGIQSFEPQVVIVIAYLSISGSSITIERAVILDDSDEYKIAPLNSTLLPIDEAASLRWLQKQIEAAEIKVAEAKANLALFETQFSAMFNEEGNNNV